MSFKCERCNSSFKSQQELDRHERIYFYNTSMNEPHDLASLENTVEFLEASEAREQENNRTIWKYYTDLERKYLQLLGVLDKHTDSNGKPDAAMNALYKQEAKNKQTVFEPVNRSGELLLLLQAESQQNKEKKEK